MASRHSRIVEAEFERQAEAFASSPELNAPEITGPIRDALAGFEVGRVLDVACGPGVLSAVLCQNARHVVGLDLTDAALRLARRRCARAPGAMFVRGLAEFVPFGAGCFDAAVLRLALHHVERPARVLGEVRRLLRSGGRLVVLDILTSSQPEVAELHNAIERLRDPSHTALLPPETHRSQLREAGFNALSESSWETVRDFTGWARIITEERRMASLEVLLRHLARAGVGAGIDLREQGGELRFTYKWGLFVAESP